jgi:Protein of unknown function (DUF3467)
MDPESQESQAADQIEARYANYFKVWYNALEFLLDFGQFYPESERPRLHTRIVTSPTYAKALLTILRGSIEEYQKTFGDIHEH